MKLIFNSEERFLIIQNNTLAGNFLNFDLAWFKLLREIGFYKLINKIC